MSTEEKVDLVASVWQDYGLAAALAALELPKSPWLGTPDPQHRQSPQPAPIETASPTELPEQGPSGSWRS